MLQMLKKPLLLKMMWGWMGRDGQQLKLQVP
jgi:hypothetical protein